MLLINAEARGDFLTDVSVYSCSRDGLNVFGLFSVDQTISCFFRLSKASVMFFFWSLEQKETVAARRMKLVKVKLSLDQ